MTQYDRGHAREYEKGYKFGYAQALLDLEDVFAECMRKMNGGKDDSN